MKNEIREKEWLAYLDGQLNAAEAASFDDALSDAQRDRFAQELQLERGIVEALSHDTDCPDALWNTLRAKMETPQRKAAAGTMSRRVVLLAAAAALVLLGGIVADQLYGPRDVLAVPDSVAALEAQATMAADVATIQAWLDAKGIHLAVLPIDALERPRHAMELVGASVVHFRGEEVLELLYNCCGRPSKVVIAEEGSQVAELLQQGEARGRVLGSRWVNGYNAALVSDHRSDELLDLVTPKGASYALRAV